jgi:hypothetical protein
MSDYDIDGILEKDLVDNNWELFEIKRPMTFFTLGRSYIGRPDLLSIKLYGKENYWYLLLKSNEEIEDVWNDLEVGKVINVPDVRDFEDFVSAVKNRLQ